MAEVSCDDTHRLIPGRYTEQAEHALTALCDDDDGLTALVQLAAVTNSRLQAQEEHHPDGLGRTDMTFGLPFSQIVNAAFAYPGEGARFHPAHGRGAWYCALDLDTCLAEVAFHRIRHLEETGLSEEPDIPYRLFLADIHLHRARMFHNGDELAKAAKRIRDLGYGRRYGELLDAEQALS